MTKQMIRDFTGKQDYQFGDLTKSAVAKFTGKDEYEHRAACLRRWRAVARLAIRQALAVWRFRACGAELRRFGDITKKLGQVLFGNKEVKPKPKPKE